jgi:hypothetical protein
MTGRRLEDISRMEGNKFQEFDREEPFALHVVNSRVFAPGRLDKLIHRLIEIILIIAVTGGLPVERAVGLEAKTSKFLSQIAGHDISTAVLDRVVCIGTHAFIIGFAEI